MINLTLENLSKFIQHTQNLYYNEYCTGYLTYVELLNQVLYYVESNLADLYLDLPKEMIDTMIDYQICYHKDGVFSLRKWMKFINIYFLNPDLNWQKISDDLKEEFKVRHLDNQTFIVKEQFKTYLYINFNAPYSSGCEILLEPGTILISKGVTYYVDENISLIPLEYNKFQNKYISKEDSDSPVYNGYCFSVSINDLYKYF